MGVALRELLIPGEVTSLSIHRWFYFIVATVILAAESTLLSNLGISNVLPYLALVTLWACLVGAGWHSLLGGVLYAAVFVAVEVTGIDANELSLPVIGIYVIAADWISRSWFLLAGCLLVVVETVQMTTTDYPSAQLTSTLFGVAIAVGIGLAVRWQRKRMARLRAESEANLQAAAEASQRVRRDLAVELHDTLAKDLARVMITAQRLAASPSDDLPAELEQLAELAGTAARRLRPVILGLDTSAIDAPLLDVISTCETMLSSRGIVLDRDVPPDVDDHLTQRQRIVCGLIIREAATNVLKYAPHGCVAHLMIEQPNDAISITMTNPMSDQPSTNTITGGFGLANVAGRVEQEGGGFQFGRTGEGWMLAATVPATTEKEST